MSATLPPPAASLAVPATRAVSPKGLLFGSAAYAIWGVLPLYIHPLSGKVPPLLILCHRATWSLALLLGLLTLLGQWPALLRTLASRRTLLFLLASTAALSINWYTFTYVVTHGQTLQSSLGYFLNPLFSALLGLVVLKERLRPLQWVAMGIAATGVTWLAVAQGVVPHAALLLAGSFGLYGLLRKLAPVDALTGLTVETALLTPFAAFGLLYAALNHTPGGNPSPHLLLYLVLGAGTLTTVPLLCFSKAAKLLPLSTLGFLQYIGPTLQFLCAVLAFGEPFTHAHAVAFPLIWLAVALFITSALRRNTTATTDEHR